MTLMGSRNATREDFDQVFDALKSGGIDIDRYVTHRTSFEAMVGEFESWLDPESKVIKAIVEL
ncbi:putative L-galactonate oxidoreductase [compost metagenome]